MKVRKEWEVRQVNQEKDKLIGIRKILEKGWSKKTAFGEYHKTKSEGQCYVTARTLNYIFGWEILFNGRDGCNHYWNRLPNGVEIDFTSDQMGANGIYPVEEMRGMGKPRKFKPIDQCKSLNPRLALYLKIVKADLLKFKDKVI